MNRRILPKAGIAALVMSMSACTLGSAEVSSNSNDAGITGAETLSGQLEVVSFYPEGSPDHERLLDLGDEFESRHPDVQVKFTFGGGQDTPQIEARWRAGDPPEVNYGFFDNSLPTGGEWVESGRVLELDDAMQADLDGYDSTWEEAVLPGVRPLMTANGGDAIYAAPESVTTLQFFYNEALFEEHGLEPPETVDELVEVANALKQAGVAPFTVTGTFLPYMQLYWDYLALRHVGLEGMRSAIAGETELASLPGASEAAADLEQLVKGGYFLDGFRGTDFTAAQMSFFQGDAAMILMGSWLVGEMADAIPDGFQIGTFPFPTVESETGDQTGLFGGINGQVVARNSENPEAGVAWLRFIAEPKTQEAYVEKTGGISAYRGIPAPEGFENVSEMLEEGASFAPSYMGVLAQSQEVQTAYQQPIAQLFFGEIDGKEMLAQMSDGLTAAAGS